MRAKMLYKGFEEALDDIKRKPTTFYGRYANLLFSEEDLECILKVMKAGIEAMETEDTEYEIVNLGNGLFEKRYKADKEVKDAEYTEL